MTLLAQSETLFYLPDVKRIPTTIEFIKTDGEVTRIYWTQEKRHEGKKLNDNGFFFFQIFKSRFDQHLLISLKSKSEFFD